MKCPQLVDPRDGEAGHVSYLLRSPPTGMSAAAAAAAAAMSPCNVQGGPAKLP